MSYDLCVYGGTASGVIAAFAAAQAGHSVVFLEPGRHLGGMTSGGLGRTDVGNPHVVGGMAREFYRTLGKHYGKEISWTFEPSVAERVLNDLVSRHKIDVRLEHRLVSVDKKAAKLVRVHLENVATDEMNAPRVSIPDAPRLSVEAGMFIDATYEGDLLAAAGVDFTIGRESVRQYGEPLNGIRGSTPHHQFYQPVDPYNTPGKPDSGLLPLIDGHDGGTPGEGDHRVQAYNFRLCLTQDAKLFKPIDPPPGYDPRTYELLARHFDAETRAGVTSTLQDRLLIGIMPNGKTDVNNQGCVSTDFIGQSWGYPAGDPATRGRLWHDHLNYIKGYLHFLASSDRVNAAVRKAAKGWGLCSDEFTDTAGWPHQLYVREGRRMVSDYVITQDDCVHKRACDDAVGMAAYNMDSHNCQRIVQGGLARNEGDVQVNPSGPYPISYRAIVPERGQCDNLLVPVCLSSSHIAYGSIRMEPVFMVLGQSAAAAAMLALKKNSAVQDVSYPALRAALLDGGQILSFDKTTQPVGGMNPEQL